METDFILKDMLILANLTDMVRKTAIEAIEVAGVIEVDAASAVSSAACTITVMDNFNRIGGTDDQ